MIIDYATKRLAIHLTITGTMAARICECLPILEDQATAAQILQSQTKVTELSIAASNTKISNFMPNNQDLLLSRPVKTKHGLSPKQPGPQVRNYGTQLLSPHKLQSAVDLHLPMDKPMKRHFMKIL